jgi:hypothetical protein
VKGPWLVAEEEEDTEAAMAAVSVVATEVVLVVIRADLVAFMEVVLGAIRVVLGASMAALSEEVMLVDSTTMAILSLVSLSAALFFGPPTMTGLTMPTLLIMLRPPSSGPLPLPFIYNKGRLRKSNLSN